MIGIVTDIVIDIVIVNNDFIKILKKRQFFAKKSHFFTPKTEKKLFMQNRTLGNYISHKKIHQNEVLWWFREKKLAILLNFLKNVIFCKKKPFFYPQIFFLSKIRLHHFFGINTG